MNVTLSDADSLHAVGNAVEAGFWAVVGFTFIVVALRRTGGGRGRLVALAVAFVLFGIPDLVEIQTGAWWDPWWLFAWKAACVVFFVWQYWVYRRLRARTPVTSGLLNSESEAR